MTDRPAISAVIEHYGSPVYDRRSYMTNCVFHEDNTPSLSVNTEKDVWSCKSCGEGGDSYTMIQLKEECDFRGAREFAATLGLAEGSSGGSDGTVRSSYFGTRGAVAGRKRTDKGDGGYVPKWRRS